MNEFVCKMLVDATNIHQQNSTGIRLDTMSVLVPGKGLVRSACLNIWALFEFFIEPVWTK